MEQGRRKDRPTSLKCIEEVICGDEKMKPVSGYKWACEECAKEEIVMMSGYYWSSKLPEGWRSIAVLKKWWIFKYSGWCLLCKECYENG